MLAEDPDSTGTNITYVIRIAPKNGVLQFEDVRNRFITNLTAGMDFTQFHVDQGTVFYKNLILSSSSLSYNSLASLDNSNEMASLSDSITVDVTDGRNVLESRKVFFQVSPDYISTRNEPVREKETKNEKESSSSRNFVEDKFESTLLTKNVRTFQTLVITKTIRTIYLTLSHFGIEEEATGWSTRSEEKENPQKYIFTISKQPTVGRLQNADFPDYPLSHFTDVSLRNSKIRYSLDDGEATALDNLQNIQEISDEFEIEVNDGVTSSTKSFVIPIDLSELEAPEKEQMVTPETTTQTPIRKVPIKRRVDVQILPIRAKTSETVDLAKVIQIKDDSTDNDTVVVFTLKSAPRAGFIVKRGKSVLEFTSIDVSKNLVFYKQSGANTQTEPMQDRFELTASTAGSTAQTGDEIVVDLYVNNRPVSHIPHAAFSVTLEIEPVDEKKPEIVLNLGTSNVRNLSHHISEATQEEVSSLERRQQVIGFKLSPKSLLVDDPDSDPDSVKFVVTKSPEHGKIMRKSKNIFNNNISP